MSARRVVITGLGAVTPVGNNVKEMWKSLIEGRSGVGAITIFDAEKFPTKIAGEIKQFDFLKWVHGNGKNVSLGRNSHFALEASSQAVQDAGLGESKTDATRLGIYFGAGDGGFDFEHYALVVKDAMNETSSVDAANYFKNSVARIKPHTVLEQEPYQVINHLAEILGARGPVFNCLTACAASSQAIGEAAEMIRHGDADVMVTGGTHSMIHPLGIAGFNLLTALSTLNSQPQKASRPFDKKRDGFVLSEGAAVLVLEDLDHAKKRGAKIYAEFGGYGSTADAFRLTDPHPDGRGAIQAMKWAIKDARISAGDVDYINAHGTSTKLNDEIETRAIKEVFKDRAYATPVSSIKSMLGHMIAAAGAVELIASVLTLRDQVIPPTINYEEKDEVCDLDYVPNEARKAKVRAVMSNSFGFGGQNIALVVKKFEG